MEAWFVRATEYQNTESFQLTYKSTASLTVPVEAPAPDALYPANTILSNHPEFSTQASSVAVGSDKVPCGGSSGLDFDVPPHCRLGGKTKVPRFLKPEERPTVHKFLGYAAEDDLEKLSVCVSSGMELDACDMFGWTALMCAAHRGHYRIVSYLVQAGADRGIKNSSNQSAAELARTAGFLNVASFLEELDNYERVDCDVPEDNLDSVKSFSPFVCDTCGMMFHETSQEEHQTSTLHLLSISHPPSRSVYGLSERNVGFRLLQKAGWDEDRGLGAKGDGRKYPIRTVFKQDRKGLGAGRYTAKVTHYPHLEKQVKKDPVAASSNRKEILKDVARTKRKEVRLRRSLHGI